MTSVSIDALTPREREILTLIAEGDSLAEIAQKLSRSLKTIESHRLSIGRKLKASNRVELAKIAIAQGLVSLGGSASSDRSPSDLPQQWINEINLSIEQATGRELIERFCVAASKLPGIDIAAMCTNDRTAANARCDLYSRVIMAVAENGQLAKPMRYNAMQTPCQEVIDNGSLSIPHGILDHFPNDPWLVEVKAQGYLGLMLNKSAGEPVGGIGLISKSEMSDSQAYRQVIDFFAPRLAGAIQVCVEIESLRSENDRLQAAQVVPLAHALPRGESEGDTPVAVVRIAQRVNQLAGAAFLREFINATCQEYGLFAGGICSMAPSATGQTLQTVSFCMDRKQSDTIEYEAKGTPCEFVLQHATLCLPDQAAQSYPGDAFLQEHNIRGFCGSRLPSPAGETAGVVWVMHQEPLPDPGGIEVLLKYYAPRIGAELANFMQLELLLQEREQLESQLKKQGKARKKASA